MRVLRLSNNRLNGSLPNSRDLLLNLKTLDISYNLLTGVVTKAQFSKLTRLKYLYGIGNNLTLQPDLGNWIPTFQLQLLYLSFWDLGIVTTEGFNTFGYKQNKDFINHGKFVFDIIPKSTLLNCDYACVSVMSNTYFFLTWRIIIYQVPFPSVWCSGNI